MQCPYLLRWHKMKVWIHSHICHCHIHSCCWMNTHWMIPQVTNRPSHRCSFGMYAMVDFLFQVRCSVATGEHNRWTCSRRWRWKRRRSWIHLVKYVCCPQWILLLTIQGLKGSKELKSDFFLRCPVVGIGWSRTSCSCDIWRWEYHEKAQGYGTNHEQGGHDHHRWLVGIRLLSTEGESHCLGFFHKPFVWKSLWMVKRSLRWKYCTTVFVWHRD